MAIVDTLLTASVPVDATDHKGLTPLMMACMFGRSMMAAYLLGKVNSLTSNKQTTNTLYRALRHTSPTLMVILLFTGRRIKASLASCRCSYTQGSTP